MDAYNTTSRRSQFTLRTLLAFVALCAVLMGVIKTIGIDIALGFCGFVFSGALVVVLLLVTHPLDRVLSRHKYSTVPVSIPIVYAALGFIFYVFGGVIDQPHPTYAQGTWLTYRIEEAEQVAPLSAVVALVFVLVDRMIQPTRPRDGAYYPRLGHLWRGLSSVETRLMLIVGISLVAAYYTLTVIEVWSSQQTRCGLIWPPERVFVSCHLLWGVLWITDCTNRPRGGTMVAASLFIVFALVLCLLMGFGVVRE